MFGAVLVQAALAPAQVTNITSSGLGTTVAQPAPGETSYQITGGSRSGSNLFHSFGAFSVGEGDTASFRNTTPDLTTNNIIGRVTGGEVSNIFGTIDTLSYPEANLYLVNPAGVVFGPNAKLDVARAFHASTADYIRFADGAEVFVDPSRNSTFTVARPEAFGFLGPAPAPLSVQYSFLQVQPGQTLSLVGGDIQVTGALLQAAGGTVQIASVASPGRVVLSGPGEPADLKVDSFSRLGRVDITEFAFVDTSGAPGAGGTVLIRGGRLVVDSAFLLSFTDGDLDGARLGIDLQTTESITLANSAFLGTQTSFGSGRAGDISLSAPAISLMGGSAIRSQGGPGSGGDITLTATNSIKISGLDSAFIASQIATEIIGVDGVGNGGRITISAPSVVLADGGKVESTSSSAHGGDIHIENVARLDLMGGAQIVTNASDPGAVGGNISITADAVTLSGEGSDLLSQNFGGVPGLQLPVAGGISLDVKTLTLTDGAQIQSGNFVGAQGGDVSIKASESVGISGAAGISSHAFDQKAGAISISSPSLVITNGFIDSSTFGTAEAGDISVNTGSLQLMGGARLNSSSLSPTEDAGPGGNINITTELLQLANGASISASSKGGATALAGDINITFGDRMSMQHSTISTQSRLADGGSIAINSTGSALALNSSQITTSVGGGTGAGGNITLGTQSHPLTFAGLSNSAVQANAFGGPGGNIGIFAGVFLSNGSVVTASSALSTPGTISVEARITDVSGSLAQLPDEVLQAATLLRASCAARSAEGQASSLVVARREGVPPQPEGLLWSPLNAALPDRGLSSGGQRNAEMFPRIARLSLGSNCER